MSTLNEISPGKQFENIIIEICTLEGPVVSKGEQNIPNGNVSSDNGNPPEPYHIALVTDGNLYIKMLYKINDNIITSDFKPNNQYIISGRTIINDGRIHLEIDETNGKIERIEGHNFKNHLSYSTALDISAFKRIQVVVIVRRDKDKEIEYFLKTDDSHILEESNQSRKYGTDREMAINIIKEKYELNTDDIILFHMHPISYCEKTIENNIYHLHIATLIENVNVNGSWLKATDLKELIILNGIDDKEMNLIDHLENNLNELENCGYLKLQINSEIINNDGEIKEKESIPVMLINGYVGSGKTTLIKNILENKKRFKCAVIILNISELVMDASVLKNINKKKEVIEMKNDYKWSTLKDKLIEEIRKIIESNNYDYIIIECSGLSEPIKVVETLYDSMEGELNSLGKKLKLDTSVNVIDVLTVYNYINEIERINVMAEGHDKDLVNLIINQIQFSDIILINKADLMDKSDTENISDIIKNINNNAEIILTEFCQIDFNKILNTNKFNFEKVKDIRCGKEMELSSDLSIDLERFGITNFVYSSNKPFHSERLFAFMNKYLIIQQEDIINISNNEEIKNDVNKNLNEEHIKNFEEISNNIKNSSDAVLKAIAEMNSNNSNLELLAVSALQMAACSSALSATLANSFLIKNNKTIEIEEDEEMVKYEISQIIRSKGIIWVAGKEDNYINWNQTRNYINISNGGSWHTIVPEETSFENDKKDELGFKRQEIEFIGHHLNKEAIKQYLDNCLCTEEEYKTKGIPEVMKMPSKAKPKSKSKSKSDITEKNADNLKSEEYEAFKITSGREQLQEWLRCQQPGQRCYVLWYTTSNSKITAYLKESKAYFKNTNYPFAILDIHATALNKNICENEILPLLSNGRKIKNLTKKEFKNLIRNEFPCMTCHVAPDIQVTRTAKGNNSFQRITQKDGMKQQQTSDKAKTQQQPFKEENWTNTISEYENTISKNDLTTQNNISNVNESESVVQYNTNSVYLGKIDLGNVIEIRRGATDLKNALNTARERSLLTVVLWLKWDCKSYRELRFKYETFVPSAFNAFLLIVDRDTSQENTVLCNGLNIMEFPCLQFYEDMKLKKSIQTNIMPNEIELIMLDWMYDNDDETKNELVAYYDPPPAYSNASDNEKTVITRNFKNKGMATFWPKMPCLNCGCPWWLGNDDVENECVRCGWKYKNVGYDEEGLPEEKYQQRYDCFMRSINSGKTPEYHVE